MPPNSEVTPEHEGTVEQRIRRLEAREAAWNRRLLGLANANEDMSAGEVSKSFSDFSEKLKNAIEFAEQSKTETEKRHARVLAGLWALCVIMLTAVAGAFSSWSPRSPLAGDVTAGRIEWEFVTMMVRTAKERGRPGCDGEKR